MRGGGDSSSGKLRGDQIASGSQRSAEFHTNLEVYFIVEINRDVSPSALDLMSADGSPNLSAGLGNNLHKLWKSRAAPDNGQRPAGELLDLDAVVHNAEF
jgi:hypothetical protein